jgi:hypothetical protein
VTSKDPGVGYRLAVVLIGWVVTALLVVVVWKFGLVNAVITGTCLLVIGVVIANHWGRWF